jgi:hypothetical protein
MKLVCARNGEIKLNLPKAEIKTDGTIWMQGMPVLGAADLSTAEKSKLSAAIKARRYSDVPPDYFCKMGYNSNGLWCGTYEDYKSTPEAIQRDKAAQAREAEAAELRKVTATIHLSTRGWGDYSSVEWQGNITRPDAEILAECRAALNAGHDVDRRNQTDAEILAAITAAREKWQAIRQPKPASQPIKHGPGYCYSCDSYCFGDCGHYAPEPTARTMQAELQTAIAEQNYGIQD